MIDMIPYISVYKKIERNVDLKTTSNDMSKPSEKIFFNVL